MALKINDEVVVTSGNHKGQRGKVMQINGVTQRVTVEGVNMRVQFLRKTQENPQGGEVERETPLHVSSLLLWSEKAGKGVRVRVKKVGDSKVRVGIPCGTHFDS